MSTNKTTFAALITIVAVLGLAVSMTVKPVFASGQFVIATQQFIQGKGQGSITAPCAPALLPCHKPISLM